MLAPLSSSSATLRRLKVARWSTSKMGAQWKTDSAPTQPLPPVLMHTYTCTYLRFVSAPKRRTCIAKDFQPLLSVALFPSTTD